MEQNKTELQQSLQFLEALDKLKEAEALEKMLEPIKDTDLAAEIISLWNEFEHAQTPEAVFLRGLDRFLPMYHNYKTNGHSWVKYKVTKQMVLTKNSQIEQSSEKLWDFTKTMLNESQIKGWIL
jgi:putative hydrolase of HD superfamily